MQLIYSQSFFMVLQPALAVPAGQMIEHMFLVLFALAFIVQLKAPPVF